MVLLGGHHDFDGHVLVVKNTFISTEFRGLELHSSGSAGQRGNSEPADFRPGETHGRDLFGGPDEPHSQSRGGRVSTPSKDSAALQSGALSPFAIETPTTKQPSEVDQESCADGSEYSFSDSQAILELRRELDANCAALSSNTRGKDAIYFGTSSSAHGPALSSMRERKSRSLSRSPDSDSKCRSPSFGTEDPGSPPARPSAVCEDQTQDGEVGLAGLPSSKHPARRRKQPNKKKNANTPKATGRQSPSVVVKSQQVQNTYTRQGSSAPTKAVFAAGLCLLLVCIWQCKLLSQRRVASHAGKPPSSFAMGAIHSVEVAAPEHQESLDLHQTGKSCGCKDSRAWKSSSGSKCELIKAYIESGLVTRRSACVDFASTKHCRRTCRACTCEGDPLHGQDPLPINKDMDRLKEPSEESLLTLYRLSDRRGFTSSPGAASDFLDRLTDVAKKAGYGPAVKLVLGKWKNIAAKSAGNINA